MDRLPNFICVGAQKAGTTWLYRQLEKHPQIYMRLKEINYFHKQHDFAWYIDHFKDARSDQICGDISPNYGAFQHVSKKIHDECPNVQILHFLRNPVDRAFSQWRMARYLGNMPRELSFIECFRQNLQYIRERGEYVRIIEEYADYFPLNDQSRVFWYDDIRFKPDRLLVDVLNFIGVDHLWQSPHLNEIVWPSPDPGLISHADALEVKAYYEPFDMRLRQLLRKAHLPWDGCVE
ncbi:sulfotransferase domain-containing protein [Brucella intermedia]|uniref:sulfotransferase domain-containing protein n=1 Tax=Brucella intermedia TaxID=94625 RepID=UPI002361EE7A|nr:sulfotransferase domain-containing protein [Brucella intermedia]